MFNSNLKKEFKPNKNKYSASFKYLVFFSLLFVVGDALAARTRDKVPSGGGGDACGGDNGCKDACLIDPIKKAIAAGNQCVSGARTEEKQACLKAQLGDGAASPGNSRHEVPKCAAVDIKVASCKSIGLKQLVNGTHPANGEVKHCSDTGG